MTAIEGAGAVQDPLRAFLQAKKQEVPTNGSTPTSGATPKGGSATVAGPHLDVAASLGRAGTGAATAREKIELALAPMSNVDFPMITDICERLAAEACEASEAVGILVAALGPQSHARRRLKALTILREVAESDKHCLAELQRCKGARPALQELRELRGSGLGEASDEHIRIFATELERTTFIDASAPGGSPETVAPPMASHTLPLSAELLGGMGQAIQTNLSTVTASLSSLPLDPAICRQRDKAFELLREVGSTMQSNLAVAGLSGVAIPRGEAMYASSSANVGANERSGQVGTGLPPLPPDDTHWE